MLLIFVGLFLPEMVDYRCYRSFEVLMPSCGFFVALVTSHSNDDEMMLLQLMWMIPCCCDLFLFLVALTMMMLMGERQMLWLWRHSCIASAGRCKMSS